MSTENSTEVQLSPQTVAENACSNIDSPTSPQLASFEQSDLNDDNNNNNNESPSSKDGTKNDINTDNIEDDINESTPSLQLQQQPQILETSPNASNPQEQQENQEQSMPPPLPLQAYQQTMPHLQLQAQRQHYNMPAQQQMMPFSVNNNNNNNGLQQHQQQQLQQNLQNMPGGQFFPANPMQAAAAAAARMRNQAAWMPNHFPGYNTNMLNQHHHRPMISPQHPHMFTGNNNNNNNAIAGANMNSNMPPYYHNHQHASPQYGGGGSAALNGVIPNQSGATPALMKHPNFNSHYMKDNPHSSFPPQDPSHFNTEDNYQMNNNVNTVLNNFRRDNYNNDHAAIQIPSAKQKNKPKSDKNVSAGVTKQRKRKRVLPIEATEEDKLKNDEHEQGNVNAQSAQASESLETDDTKIGTAPLPLTKTTSATATTITGQQFPEKLYRLLIESEKLGQTDIACFTSTGDAFRIYNRHKFVNSLASKYFKIVKYSSFRRQLYLYNFTVVDGGPNKGAYHHPDFIRDQPGLLQNIKRNISTSNKDE